jgi:peptidoglycan/xylan/chitin deacetylase (PgdA/CDA1 family)
MTRSLLREHTLRRKGICQSHLIARKLRLLSFVRKASEAKCADGRIITEVCLFSELFRRICLIGSAIFGLLVILISSVTYAEEKRNGIVLAFDDGYPSWINIIAPELARVGGRATCFVNNQRIYFGDLSFEDLRALQNKYGWEIGTHTYHHFNAPAFVQQRGLLTWIENELEASLIELQSEGLKIQSMVFPYNAFTGELCTEVMKRLKNFRRDDVYPINDRTNGDGSMPGTEIDIAFYIPISLVFKWIDFARLQDKMLFLYGHKVLPDEDFFTGTVASISAHTLISTQTMKTFTEKDLCLVPHIRRRLYRPLKVVTINGDAISILQGDLTRMSEVGATFVVGPCYGIQLSYFHRLIEYAADRLPFYTVGQAIDKMQYAPKQ